MPNNSKFRWGNSTVIRKGTLPAHELEVFGEIEDNNLVMTGIGARVGDDHITTLHLQVAPIKEDGTLGSREIFKHGMQPNHELEVMKEVNYQEVIVGVGARVGNDNLTTLKIYSRYLDPTTGELGDLKVYHDGIDPYHDLEIDWQPETNSKSTILTGIGARVGDDNLTTLHLKTSQLNVTPQLSRFKVTGDREIRIGTEPGHNLETFYQTFSDHLVLVGIGFRVGDDDLTTMVLLFAPINNDGTISKERIRISNGRIPEHELETWFECPHKRLIVGCGMRVGDDNMTTLRVHTRILNPETGELIEPKEFRVGSLPNHELEVEYKPNENVEKTLLRGIGARVGDDNVTTLRLIYGEISKLKL